MVIKIINNSQPGITYEYYYENVSEDIAKAIVILLDGYSSDKTDLIVKELKIKKEPSRGNYKC